MHMPYRQKIGAYAVPETPMKMPMLHGTGELTMSLEDGYFPAMRCVHPRSRLHVFYLLECQRVELLLDSSFLRNKRYITRLSSSNSTTSINDISFSY